jgi:hypothetical protein
MSSELSVVRKRPRRTALNRMLWTGRFRILVLRSVLSTSPFATTTDKCRALGDNHRSRENG